MLLIGIVALMQVVQHATRKGTEAIVVIKHSGIQRMQCVHLYGSIKDRSMLLYLGERAGGGRLIARADRTPSRRRVLGGARYMLTVEPCVDVAMCVLLCVAFDDFRRERGKQGIVDDMVEGAGAPEMFPVLCHALSF